jgi:eukaryotic-like serine/threonine-protein kinase
VARLGVEAAEALEHAHQEGIVHRDIKPANLMVDAKGNLWITDFGLARLQSDSGLTVSGDLLGTLRYMSPEQALGKRVLIDGRTDIYSLGVTLYEMVTLQTAFESRDRQELLRQIADEEPQSPRKLNGSIPRELETIVLKAMSKEPESRYGTAQELADDLERFLEHKPIRAKRPTLRERAAKWSHRHWPVVTTAALLLVLGTVGTSIGLVWALQAERKANRAAERARTAEVLATDRLVEVTREKERATAAEAKAKDEAAAAEAVVNFLQDDLLAQATPDKNARANKVTVEELLDRAAARIAGKFAQQPAVEARIRRTIGNTYRALSNHSAARPHLERAWELNRNALGEEDLKALDVLTDLALLDKDQGRGREAEQHFDKVLKIRRRELGEANPDTLTAMNNLADAYGSQGRHSDAESLLLKRLEISRSLPGEANPETLLAMNNLAVFYLFQHQYTKAGDLLVKVLKVQSPVEGEESPGTHAVMNNLSEVYVAQGEYLKAAELLEKTLKISRSVWGEEDRRTLWTMNNLARAYWLAKKLDRSVRLYEEMVSRCLARWGPDDYQTFLAMLNLGINYRDAGRLPEAIAKLEQAWECERKRNGPKVAPDSYSAITLADAYDRAGRFDSSEPLYRAALEAARKRHGEASVEASGVLAPLGLNLLKQRKYADAEPLLRECLKIREQRQPDDWTTFNTKSLLGAALLGQGRYAEAAPLITQGYEGMKTRTAKIPPPGKPRLSEAAARVIQLYEAWGQPEKAAAWKARLGLTDLPADVFARP